MSYMYENPNPKGKRVGDCAIRAVAAAEGLSWDEAFDQLASTWKDIETAAAMAKERESGYSEHYPYYPMMYRGGVYDDGGSYGPGRGRGSNANRDSMGRYASENRRGSYEGRGSYGGAYDDGESMGSYRNR